VIIDKPVILLGPNAGLFGDGARVNEVIINGQSGAAVTIAADGATLDGFALIGQDGLVVAAANAVAQNNLIVVNGVGATVEDGRGLLLRGNAITAATLFDLAATAELTAYANHFEAGLTAGLTVTTHLQNARHNWWSGYQTRPSGLDDDSWAYRLGAAVQAWGEAALGEASLQPNSGSGVGVIVSHGRGALANAPFGKAAEPFASAVCSPYYDFFVVNGAGDWTVSVPIDMTAACDETFNRGALYMFALTNDGAPDVDCIEGACWQPPANVISATHTVTRTLSVTLAAADFLQGTPFVAGGEETFDPTAVSLANIRAVTAFSPAPIFLLLLTITAMLVVTTNRKGRRGRKVL
jgi:hypothetical protein